MAGCNNTPKTLKLKPEQTRISGALGGFYAVVDKEYQVEEDWMFQAFNVEIERTSNSSPFNSSSTAPMGISRDGVNTHIGFGFELFDKDGNILKSYKPEDGHCDKDDIEHIINLSNGETYTLKCLIDNDEELLKKVVSFRILSVIQKDNSSPSSATNTNWDSVLDEYEKFVDNYITLYKKATAGDMSAITEYANCLESAEKLQEKLDNAQSSLTSAQLSRYTRITNKMLDAL